MELQSGIYSLAPNWMSVFQRWDDLKRFQKEALVTDLGFYNKGPVAESWQWDSGYYNKEDEKFCPECSWFSWSYSYVITGDSTLDRPILELKNEQFVDHCTHQHNGHSRSPEAHKTKARSGKSLSFSTSHKKVHRGSGQ